MTLYLFDGNRPHLLRNQSRQPLIQGHPQIAHASGAQPKRGGQDQVGAVGFKQISRTHIGVKGPGDQRHDIHQRFRRLAALRRQLIDLIECEHHAGLAGRAHLLDLRKIDILLHRLAYWALTWH